MDTKKLRQKILDLAIRGKLVPQDPNDEPASVLLERIRAEKEQLIKEGKIKRTKKSASSDTSHYENVPFEVPNNWCWINIMEILLKLTDGTHHSPKNYPKGNYKYITAKNIKNEGIVCEDVTYVDDLTHHEIFGRCNPEYGDILYIKDGATTGIVAINNLTEEFSLLSSVALLKPSKLISNKYLFYYLQSSYCYESVRSSMKGVGITRITLKQISNWNIPIPPIEEQYRIVEYIDSLFSHINLIEKDRTYLKDFLEKYRHAILNLAIVGKLVTQNPTDEPAIELLKRITPGYKPTHNRHYRQLPDSWEMCQLKDIFDITMGQSPAGNTINGKCGIEFHQGKLSFTEKYLSESGQYTTAPSKVAVPESLLLCVRAPVGIVNITKREICIGRGLCSLRPKYDIDCLYWLYMLSTLKDYFEENATGSTFKAISGDIIRNATIPFPPLLEQKRILSKINELLNFIDKITAEL